jgi:hypothetical protein
MNYTVIMRHENGLNEVLEVVEAAVRTPGTVDGTHTVIHVGPSRFAKIEQNPQENSGEDTSTLAHHPV